MALTWNDKQREIYDLALQGKGFSEIVEQGYSKVTVHRVLEAIKAGEKPSEPEAASKTGDSAPLTTVKVNKSGIATFEIGHETIPIYPLDLQVCYDHYRDMKEEIGWESDFSSTVREGMKLLRAVVTNFAPGEKEEKNNDTGTVG